MDRQKLLKGIQDAEERILFAKALDRAEFAMRRHEPQFSDFMDMAKCGRFMERMKQLPGITVRAYGGGEACERMILGFAPENQELTDTDFPIQALRIAQKNKKFGQSDLSHRDYLGSILGLGIERGKTGDIFIAEGEAICFVDAEIAAYISASLEKVSKTAVTVTTLAQGEACAEKTTEQRRVTVASMRLDAVLAEALRISRGKAQELIKSERVHINWTIAANTSCLLKPEDIVSARGYGRFRVGELGGKTKKDRIGLELEMYI